MSERVKSKLYSTARWQQLRKLAFARSYLCMYCYKKPANQIDHLSGCPDDNSHENLIPVCQSCHSRKTLRVDVVCRLINVQTLDDALVFAARKSQHCYDIPDHVLTNFTPEQRMIYDTLKANSIVRPSGLAVPGDVNDLRYVLAVNEVHRVLLSSSDTWGR